MSTSSQQQEDCNPDCCASQYRKVSIRNRNCLHPRELRLWKVLCSGSLSGARSGCRCRSARSMQDAGQVAPNGKTGPPLSPQDRSPGSSSRLRNLSSESVFRPTNPGNFFTITQKRNLANSSANFSGTKTSTSIQSPFSGIPETALCGFRNFLFSVQIHPFLPFRAASAVSPQARTALKQLASRIIIVFMLIHFDHVLDFAVVPDSASLRTPELTGSTALLHFSSCSGGNRERCCCHKILLAFLFLCR